MSIFDMLLANAMGEGGGGGGGSSDFSTAQVVIGEGVDGTLLGAIVDESESWGLPSGTLPLTIMNTDNISGQTFDVCLYNGHTLFYAYSSVAVTGNITLLTTADDTPIYDITGNGTITMPSEAMTKIQRDVEKIGEKVDDIQQDQQKQGDMVYQLLKHAATNNNTGEMERALDEYNEYFRH